MLKLFSGLLITSQGRKELELCLLPYTDPSPVSKLWKSYWHDTVFIHLFAIVIAIA